MGRIGGDTTSSNLPILQVRNCVKCGEVFYVSKDFGILDADCIRALHKCRIRQGKEVKTKRTRSSPGSSANVLRSRDKS